MGDFLDMGALMDYVEGAIEVWRLRYVKVGVIITTSRGDDKRRRVSLWPVRVAGGVGTMRKR